MPMRFRPFPMRCRPVWSSGSLDLGKRWDTSRGRPSGLILMRCWPRLRPVGRIGCGIMSRGAAIGCFQRVGLRKLWCLSKVRSKRHGLRSL